MKFRTSTLFWLIALVGVGLSAFLWVSRERQAAEQKILESEKSMAELKRSVEEYAANELGKASYFKRQLGVIDNAANLKTPWVKLVRLPNELGGRQAYRLPFLWHWKFVLPTPADFELCWAVQGIPPGDSFDVADKHKHRSHLNLENGVSRSGLLHYGNWGNEELPFSENDPLLVDVYFRIDGDSNGGDIFINYEISKVKEFNLGGGGVLRGEQIMLKAEEVTWLGECTWSRGGYSRISGFGVEHNHKQVPLLDQAFSLDEPLSLIKIRKQKELGAMKFEDQEEPCLGLQVWVQKRSGPSTDLPKVTTIKLPENISTTKNK